jgi:excisionase family DNA binding protein
MQDEHAFHRREATMCDRVLVPLPDGRWIALAREVFEAALEAGTALSAAAATPHSAQNAEALLDAEQAAARLGVTARWLEDSARAGIVPHHKFGRFIRFRVSDVAAHFKVAGAPPPTDSESVMRMRGLSRQ